MYLTAAYQYTKGQYKMIDLENVSKTYSTGVPALENINLHIDKGEFVFITGVSGSGKSTLIKLLLKELNPTSGRIVINGRNLSGIKPNKLPYLRRDIGVVFRTSDFLKTVMCTRMLHLHRKR